MYLWVASRTLLGAVFLTAAVGKLRSRSALAESLQGLRLLPAPVLRPAALVLVAAELAVPAFVAVERTARTGLIVALGLTVMLTSGVAWALARRSPATCRCFGGAPIRLGPRHLLRNLILAAVAVVGLLAAERPGAHPAGLVLATTGGLVLAAVLVRFDDIADLFLAPT